MHPVQLRRDKILHHDRIIPLHQTNAVAVLARGAGWTVVEQAFERVTRERLSALSAWLETQTGDKWHEQRALRMLRNPVYSAIPGYHKAQAALDARGQMGRGARDGEKALLAGLKCGNPSCDASGPKPSPMYRINARGTLYYRCSGKAPRQRGCGNMIRLETLDQLVLNGLEIWWQEPYMEPVFIPGNDVSEAIDALKARLPNAKDRKAAGELWDQIEALEHQGSTPPKWDERDSGISKGEYLATASLAEQRTFLAARDIKAWHEGPQVLATVDGAVCSVGGRSSIGDFLATGQDA